MKKKKQQIILNLFFTDFVITISFIKEEPFKEQTCIFYMHYTSILFVWLKIKESICNDTHCKTWIL